jgi:hypothetical protein
MPKAMESSDPALKCLPSAVSASDFSAIQTAAEVGLDRLNVERPAAIKVSLQVRDVLVRKPP